MARRNVAKSRHHKRARDAEKRRKTSLFRKISSKRASAEMQQLAANSGILSGTRPFQVLNSPVLPAAPSSSKPVVLQSPPTNSSNQLTLDSPLSSPSEDSSTPCSPGGPQNRSARPSSLHGLKHKLHIKTKNLHSPNRRKSVGHIPFSPLARTPSPSPLPTSRSPSPLALPMAGHQPGSSNTTQTYSPCSSLTPNKKSFSRPKSVEPSPAGSPLLRRALSPDRLNPRSSEGKKLISISPLCSPNSKVSTSTTTSSTSPLPSRATHSSPLALTSLEQQGE